MWIIKHYIINIKLIGTETFNECDKYNDLNDKQAVKNVSNTYLDKNALDNNEIKQFEA